MPAAKMCLAAAALLLSSGAFAEMNYHLANPGMCNKTDKAVRISYSQDDENSSDFKPDGITKDRKGQTLEPGKCATLSFKSAGSIVGKVVDTGTATAQVTFYVNDGKLPLVFHGDRHEINRGKQHHPTGYDIHSSSGHNEHFHIEIRRRVKSPSGRDDGRSDTGKGGDGGGEGGGEGGEDLKSKAATPKK